MTDERKLILSDYVVNMAVKGEVTIKDVQTNIEYYIHKSGIPKERGLDVFLDYLIELFDVSSYEAGEQGRIDHIKKMQAKSINLYIASIAWLIIMDKKIQTDGWWDGLGTLYEEMYLGKGKASGLGQFFTPVAVCDMMALTVNEGKTKRVNDPACGSGRTLLATSAQLKAADKSIFDRTYYIGQDIDIMSVKMCAINMMIHNMRGRVIRTDTLQDPNHFDIGWEINEANYPFPCGAYSLRRIHYTEEDERKHSKKQFLIKSDMKITKDNPAYIAVKNYLDKRAKEDKLFAEAYAKENKNIEECLNFIIGEAKKRGAAVMMTDDEVFGLAVHYYDENDIKVEKVAEKVKVSTSELPTAPKEGTLPKAEAAKPKKVAKKAEAKDGERGFVGNLFDML